MPRTIDTVIFDLGGVLARNGRPSDFARRFPDHDAATVVRLMMGDYGADTDHPWHRLERGEIDLQENRRLNRAAFAAAGIEIPPPQRDGLAPDGSTPDDSAPIRFEPNEPVVDLVHELRSLGLRLGVLTNNVREFRPMWWDMLPFAVLFDDIVDSHEVGMRKPDPAIYQLALSRLGARPERTAFLDDVATNIAPATALGMVGVLVDDDPAAAVATVRRLVGLAG